MTTPSVASEMIREITDVADPCCYYPSTTWDSFIRMVALAGGNDIIRPRCNISWLGMWGISHWPEALLNFNEIDYLTTKGSLLSQTEAYVTKSGFQQKGLF